MPEVTSGDRLTESNLAAYNLFWQQKARDESINIWVDKVIRQEQRHWLFSELTSNDVGHQEEGDILDGLDLLLGDAPGLDLIGLSHWMFEETQDVSMVNPIERFLTPDGCSDPLYFALPALQRMGIPFGSMEGKEARVQMVKTSLESMAKMRKQYSGLT
ncbi:hypothetical protein ASPZODRAFT_140892 [Penicilliopsis zonata CBS 506.65]|uniref:Uncharacterized protein n=1 Tax=Penicilliopsis zonata CBS 506.65 TaxID=1073090 RepID=A0A1L9SN51_9EURO|nr:hypothetical protein ASPZODRAFT_140892 [Penicilliopsis zonata CBS 506.65]OJJ48618.1 hypothetical protein ASPZODRAFT_140892 [Penicilliopsis zonata CBS 506.65]